MKRYLMTLGAAAVAVAMIASPVRTESKYARLLADEAGRDKLSALSEMVQDGYLHDRIRSLVNDPDPLVRLRCAEVLGQIDDPEGTVFFLSRLSRDSEPSVVEAAVFSLGLAGHREETEPMVLESIGTALKSGSPSVKKTALKALGITGLKSASEAIIPYLRNFSSSIRAEAAYALTATGDSAAIAEIKPSLYDPDPRSVAAAAYAAGRLGYKKGEGQLAVLTRNEDASVRLRAVEALGRLGAKNAVDVIAMMLSDPVRMVRIKAAEALARIGDKDAAEKLVDVLESDDVYLKTVALGGIARSEEKKFFKKVLPLLDDESMMVRKAAIDALSATDIGGAREHLLKLASEGNHYDRMTALEHLGETGKAEDLVLLASTLDSGTDHFSREGAATGLGRWPEPGQLLEPAGGEGKKPVDVLLSAARGDDWVVASISITSLGKTVPSAVVKELIDIYGKASGRLDADIKLSVLGALGPLAAKDGVDGEVKSSVFRLLKEAMKEPDPRIPSAASSYASKMGIKLEPDPMLKRYWDRGMVPFTEPPLPLGERRIELVTSKGRIRVVLFGDEAPGIVASILKLASEGFYKGLNFHRVVPGFVIQGGCPRGDGWGDAGYFLRSEFNSHRYERGAMGVAHAGKDTPGSQFFFTHVAQPHLDGRYTVIGMIEDGLDVIDRIEVGDSMDIKVID